MPGIGTPAWGRHTRPVSTRLPLIAILAAASAAVLVWGLGRGDGAPATAAPAAVSPPPAVAPAAEPALAASQASGGVAATAPPAGLSIEQWATVEAGLATHPQPAAERQRLRRYFEWSDAVRRWRGARHDFALAQQVNAGLADRLANDEVSVPEARQIKAALLQTLVADEAGRVAALQAFDAGLPASAGPSAHEQAFQQRQAALVAAWQARPAAERDPAALTRQLEALRRSHFQKENTR